MATEYGLFSDEGLIEGDFYSVAEAETARTERYPEDNLSIHELCVEHRDQAASSCEECDSE